MIKFKIFRMIFFMTSYICATYSCTENNLDEYKKLEKERDSLLVIVKEINNKYVFDSVKVKTIIDPQNSIFANSDYKVEFYFIGYNNSSYFIDYDTIVNGETFKYDTLKPTKGGFIYNKKLREGNNVIKGYITTNGKYGKEVKGILYNEVVTKEKD